MIAERDIFVGRYQSPVLAPRKHGGGGMIRAYRYLSKGTHVAYMYLEVDF